MPQFSRQEAGRVPEKRSLGEERLSLVNRYVAEWVGAQDKDALVLEDTAAAAGPDSGPSSNEAEAAEARDEDAPVAEDIAEAGLETGQSSNGQATPPVDLHPAPVAPSPDAPGPEPERAWAGVAAALAAESGLAPCGQEGIPLNIHDMDSGDLHGQAERLRSVELPRVFRGYDGQQTRQLLAEAAQVFEEAAKEHEKLKREVETLRTDAEESTASKEAIGDVLLVASRAGEQVVASANESAAAIKAEAEAEAERILEQARLAAGELDREAAAVRAKHEQDNAHLREELERDRARLRREAEEQQALAHSERETLIQQARAEAEQILAGAREQAERLQRETERLRPVLSEKLAHFVEITHAALAELDRLDDGVRDSDEADLLRQLQPARPEAAESETPAAPAA
jgi:cell division septum initiation protein DivIVA